MMLSWQLRWQVKTMDRKALLEVNRHHRLGVDETAITSYKLDVARSLVGSEISRRLGPPRLPGAAPKKPLPQPRRSSDINPYDIQEEEQ